MSGFKFKNAERLTRDRKQEGETGTGIGFPGGDRIRARDVVSGPRLNAHVHAAPGQEGCR